MTTVLARGTFATGANAAGLGDQQSESALVGFQSSGVGTIAISGDIDASNTVRLQKRTTPGGAFSTVQTYNAVTTPTNVSVAAGEEYRVITVAMQPFKAIHYKFSLES
jgi:hypothetical protein